MSAPACPIPQGAGGLIELGHGGGGAMTRRLIDEIFRPGFGAGAEDFIHDGALLDLGGGRLAFTTDSYVVRPLFFPGGDIGALAVNGTVNDLAMCGAEPLWLSVGLVLEEGFPIAELRRIVASMRRAADAAGVGRLAAVEPERAVWSPGELPHIWNRQREGLDHGPRGRPLEDVGLAG